MTFKHAEARKHWGSNHRGVTYCCCLLLMLQYGGHVARPVLSYACCQCCSCYQNDTQGPRVPTSFPRKRAKEWLRCSGLNWCSIFQGWLQLCRSREAAHIWNLFGDSFLTISGITIFIPSKEDKNGYKYIPERCRRLYVFIFMWIVGAFLEPHDRCTLFYLNSF